MMKNACSLLLAFMALTFPAWSAPGLINYQGRLTDKAGLPITTARNITFTFWNAATGGSQLGAFTDTDSVTPDANGVYATLIGDDPSLLIPESIFAADSVWLNVNVGGENLSPRKRITSVGYALSAETVKGMEVGRQDFIAAETIAAGNLVMLDDNGKIRRADNAGSNHKAIFSRENVGWPISGLIAPNKILIIYQVLLPNNITAGRAVVGSIDGSNNITFGEAVTFCDELNGVNAMISMAKLDDNRMLLSYCERGVVYLVVLKALNNALTVGPPVAIPAVNGNIDSPSCTPLGTNKALVAYQDIAYFMGGADARAMVVNATDTSLTLNASAVFNSAGATGIKAIQMVADQAMIVYKDGNLSSAIVATASGNTLSFGTEKRLNTVADTQLYAVGLGPDKVFAVYDGGGAKGSVLTIIGTSITSGTPISLASQAIGPMTPMGYDKFFMIDYSMTLGQLAGTGRIGTASGNNVTFGSPIRFHPESMGMSSATGLSSSAVLAAYAFFAAGNYPTMGYAKVLTTADQGDTLEITRCIGVAEAAAAAGANCPVTISGGVTTRFSGLVPGRIYRASEDGLDLDFGSFKIGQALGAGKLLILRQ